MILLIIIFYVCEKIKTILKAYIIKFIKNSKIMSHWNCMCINKNKSCVSSSYVIVGII